MTDYKLVAKLRCAVCAALIENEQEAIEHVKSGLCVNPFFTTRYIPEVIEQQPAEGEDG